MAKQGQVQVENQPHPPAHRPGIYMWLRRPPIDTSDPDDDDRDGLQNIGSIQTPDMADSLRTLHQLLMLYFNTDLKCRQHSTFF
jgi:hypothetical protein